MAFLEFLFILFWNDLTVFIETTHVKVKCSSNAKDQ